LARRDIRSSRSRQSPVGLIPAGLSHLVSTLVGLVLALTATRYVFASPLLSPLYSLQLHIGVIAALVMGGVLLLRRSRHALLVLICALIILGHAIAMTLGDSDTAPAGSKGKAVRVLSFNALGENIQNGERIADTIIASRADFVVILEAQPVGPYLKQVRQIYPFSIGCGVLTTNCDLLLLSRHPLSDQRLRNLSGLRPERLATATASLDGRSLHLMAVHLSKSYYDHYHALELRRMARFLKEMPGPAVLAGDFNASSLAPDMQAFLKKSAMRRVRGEPSTWPTGSDPLGLAIDHIYARSPAQLLSVTRMDDAMGSNHHGMIADLLLPDN
jgi:endonuclease/exonuclease/phosphatase (EEP) superfamily protein YafD